MSIQGILMIILYSLMPWWWLILLALIAIVLTQVFHQRRAGSVVARPVLWVSLGVGVMAMLVAPAITHSKLTYLFIWPDWLALIMVGIAVAIYAYIVLSPVWRTR